MKNIVQLAFLMIVCGRMALAQTYPVQASLTIIPPYSVHLSDYVNSDKLAVHVLFNDPVRAELAVKLRISIEGQGITLATKPEFNAPPLFLQSGFPERLTGADLAPYLDPRNLNFQGLSRSAFEKKSALPSGVYRLCIEVWEHTQNKKVSNTACSTVWMILNDPPLINTPRNGEKIRIQDPQLVVFNWTPRHTGSPNSAFSTEYEIELVEIRSMDGNPNNAMLTMPRIFTATTQSTSYYYGMAETPLIPGQKYAFRVRAKAMSGVDELDLFKNNGYSEVYAFTYGDHCLAPEFIKAVAANPTNIRVSWNPLLTHTAFTVRYKENTEQAEWFEKNTLVNELMINSLRPETEYLVQVVGFCGVISHADVRTYTVKTPKASEGNFSCGATPGPVIKTNSALIDQLKVGDVIESSNFKIALKEVTKNGDSYSGKGVAFIPWFRLAGLKVEFKDIKVNTDRQVIYGNVYSTASDNSTWVYNVPRDDDPRDTGTGTGGGTAGNGNGSGGNSAGNGTDTSVIHTDRPVITLDGKGGTTIVNESGQVFTVPQGETVTLVDGQGNETTITGGSTTPSGGGPSGGNGQSGAGNALADEDISLLKEAVMALKDKNDFSQLPVLKEKLWLDEKNLQGSIEHERELLLQRTSSNVRGDVSACILMHTADVTLDHNTPLGPSKFKLYKESEKAYNELALTYIVYESRDSADELKALSQQLYVDGKRLADYLEESKEKVITKEQKIQAMVQSIEAWIASKL